MFYIILYEILFFAIPIICIAFSGVSLYSYISAKKQNKVAPGTYSDAEIKKRKIIFIVLSVIASVPVVIVIGYIALMFMVIAYM